MIRSTRPARQLLATTMMAALVATAGASAAIAELDDELVDELLAIEQTKLDPWYGESSTEVYILHIADDSTYFDP